MRFAARLFTLFCLSTIAIAPSVAHTILLYTVPKRDQIISTFPNEISLTFDEDLLTIDEREINSFEVVSSTGKSVRLLPPKIMGAKISATVNDGALDFGSYTVSYRIVAGDGHVVETSYNFTYQSENLDEEIIERQMDESSPSSGESATDSQTFLNLNFAIVLVVVLPLLLIFTWFFIRRHKKG